MSNLPARLAAVKIALTLAVLIAAVTPVKAQNSTRRTIGGQEPQGNQIQLPDENHPFPSIRYGNPRQSSRWLQTTNGTRVAVDDGISHDGVAVYMALTWHLVAIDEETQETIWSSNVSAFWNEMAIEKVETENAEEPRLVVALRTGRDDDTAELVERYDLRTGEKLVSPADRPAGKPIKPVKQFFGANCASEEKLAELVTDQQRWEELFDEYFSDVDEALPRKDLFDENTQVVLVMSSGSSSNCRGISAQEVYEDDKRFLVRLRYHTYQSDGDPPRVQPWGIMVLPKDKARKYIIESNRQRYIGAPPIWKTLHEFEIDEP